MPKTVDSGPASSLTMALLINLVVMSIFAVQHSGMARQGFKKLFMRFASPAIERSTYVLLASLTRYCCSGNGSRCRRWSGTSRALFSQAS
ncbi:hypothetical protein [Bradyrhizobium sp. AZCC 1693]|uniref:hypothetical protein n=1 Tax=Bradyrhizobium sp. AZCC 1693 TaxID=3117029 RepID=UPI002FF39F8F